MIVLCTYIEKKIILRAQATQCVGAGSFDKRFTRWRLKCFTILYQFIFQPYIKILLQRLILAFRQVTTILPILLIHYDAFFIIVSPFCTNVNPIHIVVCLADVILVKNMSVNDFFQGCDYLGINRSVWPNLGQTFWKQ